MREKLPLVKNILFVISESELFFQEGFSTGLNIAAKGYHQIRGI